jgi:hypothetical protein
MTNTSANNFVQLPNGIVVFQLSGCLNNHSENLSNWQEHVADLEGFYDSPHRVFTSAWQWPFKNLL